MAIRSISIASMISIVFILLIAICENAQAVARQPARTAVASIATPPRALLERYCVPCHNDKLRTARLTLETLDVEHVGQNAEVWEKVLRKLRTGVMPPAGRPRPAPDAKTQFVAWLEASLDRAAQNHPDPGRPAAVHRLKPHRVWQRHPRSAGPPGRRRVAASPGRFWGRLRQHRGRLVSLAVAAGTLHVGGTEGQPVSRRRSNCAFGYLQCSPQSGAGRARQRRPAIRVTGRRRLRHYFPVDGEYLIKLRLQRNFLDEIRGMADANQIEIRIDGVRVKSFYRRR